MDKKNYLLGKLDELVLGYFEKGVTPASRESNDMRQCYLFLEYNTCIGGLSGQCSTSTTLWGLIDWGFVGVGCRGGPFKMHARGSD